jgi:hypothetical protein
MKLFRAFAVSLAAVVILVAPGISQASETELFCWMKALGTLTTPPASGICNPTLSRPLLLTLGDSPTEISTTAKINADSTIASQSQINGANWIRSVSHSSLSAFELNWPDGLFPNNIVCTASAIGSDGDTDPPSATVSYPNSRTVKITTYLPNKGGAGHVTFELSCQGN